METAAIGSEPGFGQQGWWRALWRNAIDHYQFEIALAERLRRVIPAQFNLLEIVAEKPKLPTKQTTDL